MHAIQGAMAIRRERQKREHRRQSQIRRSSSKAGRSPRDSQVSDVLDDLHAEPEPPKGPKTESGLTAFHLGVVFILLGFLMVFSAMITNSMVEGDWSRLLGVGVTFIMVGLIMVMVNRIITTREEEELAKYVSGRLARSRSGYHIGNRDLEAAEGHYRNSSSRRGTTKSLNRASSVRRSFRGQPQPQRSSSTHMHLSVKNGNNGAALHPAEEVAKTEAVVEVPSTIAEEVVVVTEVETLLPKKDNVPALIVTRQTRKPSKRRKASKEEDRPQQEGVSAKT